MSSDGSATRKRTPLYSGVYLYFRRAFNALAEHSFFGNEKHNPNTRVHWAKEKSPDHPDCVARHNAHPYALDPETGKMHLIAGTWRQNAWLEVVLEAQELGLVTREELEAGTVEAGELGPMIVAYRNLQRNCDGLIDRIMCGANATTAESEVAGTPPLDAYTFPFEDLVEFDIVTEKDLEENGGDVMHTEMVGGSVLDVAAGTTFVEAELHVREDGEEYVDADGPAFIDILGDSKCGELVVMFEIEPASAYNETFDFCSCDLCRFVPERDAA